MKKSIHAFSNDCLSDYDGFALAKLIQSREVSKKEIIESTINRIEILDAHLNGLAIDNFQQALESSEIVNGGFFDGVPTLIKDNMPLTTFPTQHGSEAIVEPIIAEE
ncbi:MAG: amidase family protein, partial [Candidatus Marinimicrobia bacterium]|nr:amidase family protein [Candidatus Neomarinimicrobiota bacterium]